jgi:ABC-2 type transport system permease protein
MLPMWLLGGSFFSNERFPDALQPLVQAIPLTHLNAAFREVAQGGGLADCGLEIAVVCGFAAAFFLLAVRRFRWG